MDGFANDDFDEFVSDQPLLFFYLTDKDKKCCPIYETIAINKNDSKITKMQTKFLKKITCRQIIINAIMK